MNRRVATIPVLIHLFTDASGWCGVVCVGYGLWASYTTPWAPLEEWAPSISAALTLIGTIITAASVYVPMETVRRPWLLSKRMYAPMVIVACLVALAGLVTRGHLPPVMVNGFALLAIAGGLKRMLPYPRDPLVEPPAPVEMPLPLSAASNAPPRAL